MSPFGGRRLRCRSPKSEGKRRTTISFEWFLGHLVHAPELAEVAQIFATSWETVFRSVERAVEWGRSQAGPPRDAAVFARVARLYVDTRAEDLLGDRTKAKSKYLSVAATPDASFDDGVCSIKRERQ